MTLLRYKNAEPKAYNGKAYASFSDLVNDMFNTSYSESNVATRPAANIREESNQFVVELAIPGHNKKSIKIDVENENLKVSGNLEIEQKEDESHRRREFNYSSFEREFILPEIVDTTKISAKYENGILYLHLPKKEEAVDQPPRQINID